MNISTARGAIDWGESFRPRSRVAVQAYYYCSATLRQYSLAKMGGNSSRPSDTVPLQERIKYSSSIKISFRAYDAWRDHDGKFNFYMKDDERKVCLRKPDDDISCIIIELKVQDQTCFVQCMESNWEPPNGGPHTSSRDWTLGTALYACHTYATKNYSSVTRDDINRNAFAKGLVGYMISRGPSDDAIKNHVHDVENLMKWASQLDINIEVCSMLS